MNVQAFVAELAAHGVQLWHEGDQVRFRGPRHALTSAHRAALAAERPAVLAYLRSTGVHDGPAADMSFAQQRLWFFDQMERGRAAYNLPIVARLFGRIDVDALEAALTAVRTRHSVLRAVFRSRDGLPVQLIVPPARWQVPVIEVPGASQRAREEAALRLVASEFARPFDLAVSTARATLLRIDAEHHVLAITVHHIVADGWSLGIIARELTVCYEAQSNGREPALPPLAMQYGDFAGWQRRAIAGADLEPALEYWRTQLGDAPRAIDLPTDRRRPLAQAYGGAASERRIDAALRDRVRAVGRAENATSFMIMLAAFSAVLARHSGQYDVCVGVPVSGRTLEGTEPLIGLFVDTLVVRVRIDPAASFRALIATVRDAALGAFANQGVPFEKLVEELLPTRDLGRTPLFQVMLNALNFGDNPALEFAGLRAEPVPIAGTTGTAARFDLTLYTRDDASGAQLMAVYDTALFSAARVDDLLEQVEQLLAAATAEPDTPLRAHSLLTRRAAAIVPDPTRVLDPCWHGAVHDRFHAHAQSAPDRVAAIDSNGALTYGELDALSSQLANYLVAHGVGREDTVAIHAARGVELAWAMLGVLKAGAAFVILDPAYPRERTLACMKTARPRAWIELARESENGTGDRDLVAEYREASHGSNGNSSSADEAEFAVASWHAATGAAAAWRAESTDMPRCTVGADDLAYIVFTSGSTGIPKGIAGTHGPLSHFFAWHAATFGLGVDDRFSVLSGLSHDPLLRDVLTPCWVGATMAFPDGARFGDPGYLARWLAETGVTVAHLTPAVAALIMLEGNEGSTASLPRLRRGFFGGDALARATVDGMRRVAPAAEWVNFYGASETPQAIAWYPIPADPDDTAPVRVPLGIGIEGVQLLVLTETGALAAIGELGEIHVRTPYLARGYIDQPALTAERFPVNPHTGAPHDRIYCTGDLGRVEPDGTVTFHGRRDGQVNIRGFRIELGEVEAALRAHPSVADAVVALSTSHTGDALLAAYVAPAGGTRVTSDRTSVGAMRTFLRTRLPEYMLPHRVVWLNTIPLTPNGKLDRARLPELDAAPRAEPLAARTPTEHAIVTIWEEVLSRSAVGADDNFFELGGHSLLATRVLSRLRARLGVELPLRMMFESPTVADLARAIDNVAGQARPRALEREDVVL